MSKLHKLQQLIEKYEIQAQSVGRLIDDSNVPIEKVALVIKEDVIKGVIADLKALLPKGGANMYEGTAHCDNCNKETPHNMEDSGHERDRTGDRRTCKECRWTWNGYSDSYSAPWN